MMHRVAQMHRGMQKHVMRARKDAAYVTPPKLGKTVACSRKDAYVTPLQQ